VFKVVFGLANKKVFIKLVFIKLVFFIKMLEKDAYMLIVFLCLCQMLIV
jgi:hypothetical protein